MAVGTALRRFRAGQDWLAWHGQGLSAPESFTLTSPSFAHGQPIPRRHAGKGIGEDVSPELAWSAPPEGTVELVLIVQDPDAPMPRPPLHALTLAIDPALGGLPEDALRRGAPETGFTHGRGSFGVGYLGPRPVPGHGPHAYVFQLFAVDTALRLRPRARYRATVAALRGHVVGRARLDGTYER